MTSRKERPRLDLDAPTMQFPVGAGLGNRGELTEIADEAERMTGYREKIAIHQILNKPGPALTPDELNDYTRLLRDRVDAARKQARATDQGSTVSTGTDGLSSKAARAHQSGLGSGEERVRSYQDALAAARHHYEQRVPSAVLPTLNSMTPSERAAAAHAAEDAHWAATIVERNRDRARPPARAATYARREEPVGYEVPARSQTQTAGEPLDQRIVIRDREPPVKPNALRRADPSQMPEPAPLTMAPSKRAPGLTQSHPAEISNKILPRNERAQKKQMGPVGKVLNTIARWFAT